LWYETACERVLMIKMVDDWICGVFGVLYPVEYGSDDVMQLLTFYNDFSSCSQRCLDECVETASSQHSKRDETPT
jgi:hypothetical protein